MGRIQSHVKAIDEVMFHPIPAAGRGPAGVANIVRSREEHALYALGTDGRVYTNGHLGGKICHTNYIRGGALSALVSFKIISRKDVQEHVKRMTEEAAQRSRATKARNLYRAAGAVGLKLSKTQLKYLNKISGRDVAKDVDNAIW